MNVDNSGEGFLVFVRLVEACNLRCLHCLIPSNPNRMTLDDCKMIPDKLENIIPIGSNVTIKWHGGEPTLFGAVRLKKVMDFLVADGRYNFSFEIRTNLMRVDDEWIDVFKTYFSGNVGVSWDYGIRKIPAGGDFDNAFFKNMETLSANGVTPHLAITVTKPLIKWFHGHYLELLGWIDRYGIGSIIFLRLIKTGVANDHWGDIGVTNRDYSEFIIKTLGLHVMMGDSEKFEGVYPICDYIEMVSTSEIDDVKLQNCFSGWCDSNSMTIDENGIRRGCLAMDLQSIGVSGDLYDVTVEDVENARFRRAISCDNCVHKKYCNTGCISAPRFDTSGECSGGRIIFDYINNRFLK